MVRAYFSRRVRFLLAAVVAFSLPGISLAGSVSEMDLLRQQIAALEASNRELGELRMEVAQLRSTQEDQWVNSRRKEELKSMISEVLADADMRSSLMGSHMTAGHNGKKFFLASEDGSFLLKMKGQIQFRYIGSFQDVGSGASAMASSSCRRSPWLSVAATSLAQSPRPARSTPSAYMQCKTG